MNAASWAALAVFAGYIVAAVVERLRAVAIVDQWAAEQKDEER